MALTKDAQTGSRRSVRPMTVTRSVPERGSRTRTAISTDGVWATPRAQRMKFSSERLPSCQTEDGMLSRAEAATNRPSCWVSVNADILLYRVSAWHTRRAAGNSWRGLGVGADPDYTGRRLGNGGGRGRWTTAR